VQKATGRECCDDPAGELADVGTTCEELMRDLVTDCEADINTLLLSSGLCPVDRKGVAGRRGKDVCPVLCQNVGVAGCECPKAYDSGCAEHQCLVPDEELYGWAECGDCEVYGAVLRCSRAEPVKQALMVVLIIVVVLAVAGAGATVMMASGGGLVLRRTQSVVLRKAERIGAGRVAASNAVKRVLEAYRAGFEGACYEFGWLLASHRRVFLCSVLLVMIAFAACGLPQAEVDKSATSEEWAPVGSLIASQLGFYNKWTPPSGRYPYFVLMVGPEAEGESALNRKYTEAFHRVTEGMRRVAVDVKRADGNGTEGLAYEDFCLRNARNPVFDQMYPGDKPCVQPTVLDCFFEGSWQLQNVSSGRWPEPGMDSPDVQRLEFAVGILNMIFGTSGAIFDTYRDRPSYKDLTDAEIAAIYKGWEMKHGGCQNWVRSLGLVQGAALGGLQSSDELRCPRDPEQEVSVSDAATLNGMFLMNSADRLSLGREVLSDYLVEDLRDGYDELTEELLEYFEKADNDEVSYPGTKIVVIPSNFYETVVKQLSSAQFSFILMGYGLMFTVIFWEIDLQSPMNNLAPVAAVYFMFIVALSTLAAYGLVAVMGLKYSHLMLQVLPYLSIGLGVDDMFLFLHYFRSVQNKERHSSAEVVADLVHSAGRSVSLTSLTNLFTFFGGTVVAIPALRNYLVLAGLLVLFNFISSVVCLPLLLSWWVDWNRGAALAELEEEEKKRRKAAAAAETEGEGSRVRPLFSSQAKKSGRGMLQDFVEGPFSRWMHCRGTQLALAGVWLAVLVALSITLSTTHPITVDFQITDLTPRGTYLAKSVATYQENLYNQYYRHEWLVEMSDGKEGGVGEFGRGVDPSDPVVQQKLQRAAARVSLSPEVNDPRGSHWLRRFFEFVEKRQPGAIHKTDYLTGEPVETNCAEECLQAMNRSRSACEAAGACGKYKLGHGWWMDRELFWDEFTVWRHPFMPGIDGLTSEAQGAGAWAYRFGYDQFFPEPGCETEGCNASNTLKMSFSRYEVDTRCEKTPADWQRHTREFREHIGSELGEDFAYPAPTGKYYDVELFETTEQFFWSTLAIGVCGVLVSGFIVPVSPGGALVIALSGLAGAIELTAILMLAGVSFTTTIAVSVIMSIGLSVDPVVHAVSAFEHASNEDDCTRLHLCIRYSTIPILKSNISTLISFVMMAFSAFPYVVKYSFLPLFLSVCISFVHGTLFVPSLLGLFLSGASPRDSMGDSMKVSSMGDSIKVVEVARPEVYVSKEGTATATEATEQPRAEAAAEGVAAREEAEGHAESTGGQTPGMINLA